MEWNVYYYDINENKKVYLIPWCGCRNSEAVKIEAPQDSDFDWLEFARKHIDCQIYKDEAKIDIWDQLEYRWDDFVSYCWNNK